uniref:Uncharacterized protein n=1 Tax=Arundo donax TaxID=35708 RepID=A0A0A9HDQ9_ARUDO
MDHVSTHWKDNLIQSQANICFGCTAISQTNQWQKVVFVSSSPSCVMSLFPVLGVLGVYIS